MKKVAFIDRVHPILQERLEEYGFKCDDLTTLSKAEIEIEIPQYHGIVIRSRFAMDDTFLRKATQLEFIARSGAGMENIDIAYCKARNIILHNAPEGNRNAVGEHALGMLLNLFNNLNKGDKEVREGIWDREGNRGVELDGKTVGIIGFGNNGQAFAKKLRGFDVDVLVYDKYKSNFGNELISEVSMDSIFNKADIISLHIPQNEETLFLVNDDYLSKFKKDIYIINLSRGKIIKTSSLVKNIISKRVKGACLDVLEFEKSSFENIFSDKENLPPAFNYILNSDKTLLSPHGGGWTEESYFKLSNVLANKIIEQESFVTK
jgi:D-3-phosphoglycerate dehydrogenase